MKLCFSIAILVLIFRAYWNLGWVSWNVWGLLLHLDTWSLSCDCSILSETLFRIFEHIVFCKLSVGVNKWHICFCNLMSGIYWIFHWFASECCGCVYQFRTQGSCTGTGGTLSFRGVVCWLKVFSVIFYNICTNYLFQINIFWKSYYWWCLECFFIIWVDI